MGTRGRCRSTGCGPEWPEITITQDHRFLRFPITSQHNLQSQPITETQPNCDYQQRCSTAHGNTLLYKMSQRSEHKHHRSKHRQHKFKHRHHKSKHKHHRSKHKHHNQSQASHASKIMIEITSITTKITGNTRNNASDTITSITL